MAPSLKATGAWTTFNGAISTAASLVGSPSSGNRYYLWVTWKPYATTCSVAGWTEVAEYADGTVATNNDVGSVKVACYYRDWVSGDGNPTITWSAIPNIAGYVMQLWQKDPSEEWRTPTFYTAARPATATSSGASMSSASPGGFASGQPGVIFCLAGIRDDAATFNRTTTSIADSNGTVSFNGNYVESPATHMSTTLGTDLAADLGYRLVTSIGGSGDVQLTTSMTTTGADTGAVLWVLQGVEVPAAANTGAFFAMF